MRKRILIRTALAAAAIALATTAAAQARLVRVYFPAGHYLGCGEPAADGSGIWSYDAKIAEADCRDTVRPRPATSLYVGGFASGDLEPVAAGLFTTSPGGINVESQPQIGAGALLQLTDWLALSLDLAAGSGSVTRVSAENDAQGQPLAVEQSDFHLFSGGIGARFYPLAGSRVRPHLSAGVRGVVLRPDGGSVRTDTRSSSKLGLTAGAGLDVRLTDRLSLSLAGDHGFDTGWRAGASLLVHLPRSRSPKWPFPTPPFPQPCPYGPPCEPEPCPFGPPCEPDPWPLPFPFPYPAQLHNEGMEAILADIEAAGSVPPDRPRTKDDLLALVDASARRFFAAHGLPSPPAGSFAGVAAATDQTAGSLLDRLTEGQRRYAQEIDSSLDGAPRGEKFFTDLGKRALRELGPSRALPVLAAASVAEGSSSYWRERGAAWQTAVRAYALSGEAQSGAPASAPGLADTLADVGKADAFGALGGAIGTVIVVPAVPALGPLSVPVVVGGAVVGGVGDSALTAAKKLWDSLVGFF